MDKHEAALQFSLRYSTGCVTEAKAKAIPVLDLRPRIRKCL